uniref:leucine-rich repeat domain-containing protein n=1 Tax=Eubacterium cellulosolvens TaxID=29322 RepID=UPI0012DE7EE8
MRKQKILAIVAACLVATACPSVVSAGEVEQQEATTEVYGAPENVILSGDCSATDEDHVQWSVVRKDDGKYKLVISGTGKTNSIEGISINYWLASTYGNDAYVSDVEVKEGVTGIEYGLATSTTESVSLPNGLISIGDGAFSLCKKLSQINIPDSVTDIGFGAFSGSGVTSVTIPSGITEIKKETFKKCDNLKEVNIPNSVTSICENAFCDCRSLKELNISNSLTSIGWGAFSGCSSLKEINLPNSVTTIESDAFSGSSLEKINIPNSVTVIAAGVFSQCSSLKEISIPNSVRTIADGAFYGCGSLQEISIPDSVKEIDARAFNDCDGLKEIRIPESVKTITCKSNYEAIQFWDCKSLKEIYLPHSLEKLELYYRVAYGSPLTDIYYNGTKKEWDEIEKVHKRQYVDDRDFEFEKDDWSFLGVEDVTVHFLDSEITVPAKTPAATSTPTPKPTVTATPTPTAAPGKEKAVTMYRLYNALNKEHFYTA